MATTKKPASARKPRAEAKPKVVQPLQEWTVTMGEHTFEIMARGFDGPDGAKVVLEALLEEKGIARQSAAFSRARVPEPMTKPLTTPRYSQPQRDPATR